MLCAIDPQFDPGIQKAITKVKSKLGERGRVVVRASGTEPIIRVMVDSEDRHTAVEMANSLADSVRAATTT